MNMYIDWVEITSKYIVHRLLPFKYQKYCSCSISEKGGRKKKSFNMSLSKYIFLSTNDFFIFIRNGKHSHDAVPPP